jgi:hypothetical protein
MKLSRNIDTVDSITKEKFEKFYLNRQKPLIIKGFAKLYPAGKKWNIDYLKNYCGDVTVELFDNNINAHKASAYTTPDLQMRFSDYADILTREEPSNLRMFLFNMFKKRPGLRKYFPYPYLFNGILGKMGYMFFGAKNIKVRMHQDIDMSNVLLTQFEGRKRVVLIAPEYSTLLYRLPFTTYSLVDLDKPDYEKYPGLKYVEAQECILEPGDALYMPSGYWHYITYLDWGYAVSYRELAKGFKMKLKGLLSLGVYMPFDKLMNALFGESWVGYKERLADERAYRLILKMEAESRIMNFRRDLGKVYFNTQTHINH